MKLGFLSVIKDFYGLSCELVDLRAAIVAAVLATHERHAEIKSGTSASLGRWRCGHSQLAHPVASWGAAFGYFLKATAQTHMDVLHEARRHRSTVHEYRILHKALREASLPRWSLYLQDRVRAKGWDATTMLRALRRLPRSIPQGHRWFLLKLHLNAPLTSSRLASAGLASTSPCAFCGRTAGESCTHITQCGVVMSMCDRMFAAARMPPLATAHAALMLQEDSDGASTSAVIGVFASIWRVRSSCRSTASVPSVDQLYELVVRCLDCPWLARCMPTLDRKARRQSRVQEPRPAPNTVIYRSDGASRGQGTSGVGIGGWGAAMWVATPEGLAVGPPNAFARGHLGEASNNVAEYVGLSYNLRRATRARDPIVVFEVDSKLVSRQLARHDAWACRSADLQPLRDACRLLTDELSNAGINWSVIHIFREFNATADALANQGVDEPEADFFSAAWQFSHANCRILHQNHDDYHDQKYRQPKAPP